MTSLFHEVIGLVGIAYAEEQVVAPSDQVIIFTGFIVVIVAIFVYLARDAILRKKTDYDTQELGSKKDREYEKYHSDWGDDYEDVGGRTRNCGLEADADNLPDFYAIIGVPRDATQDQIKVQYRRLAKKSHPDRDSKADAGRMAEINLAYETLSDIEQRRKYDMRLARQRRPR